VKYFVNYVWGGVQGSLIGPFKSDEDRDAHARKVWAEDGSECYVGWVNIAPNLEVESGDYTDEELN